MSTLCFGFGCRWCPLCLSFWEYGLCWPYKDVYSRPYVLLSCVSFCLSGMSVLISTHFLNGPNTALHEQGGEQWGWSFIKAFFREEMQYPVDICSLLSHIIYNQHHDNCLQFKKAALLKFVSPKCACSFYKLHVFGGHGGACTDWLSLIPVGPVANLTPPRS